MKKHWFKTYEAALEFAQKHGVDTVFEVFYKSGNTKYRVEIKTPQ